jgi:hypothetical protein
MRVWFHPAFVLYTPSSVRAGVVWGAFAPPLMQMAMRTGVIEIKLIRLAANAAKAAARGGRPIAQLMAVRRYVCII